MGGAGIGRSTQADGNFEFQNYTTATHGKHTIKFGARTRNDLLSVYTPTNFNGTYTFASFNAYTIMEQGLGPRACRSPRFKPTAADPPNSASARVSLP